MQVPITAAMQPANHYSWTRTLERISLVAVHPVTWLEGSKTIETQPSKKIVIGDSVWRTFLCTGPTSGCEGCCHFDVSLDWLDGEIALTPEVRERTGVQPLRVQIMGQSHTVYTIRNRRADLEAAGDTGCQFLTKVEGSVSRRCGIWPNNPLECQAAATVTIRRRQPDTTMVTKQGYARPHLWDEPPMCQFLPECPPEEIDTMIALWSRYEEWAQHLRIVTVIPRIVSTLVAVRDGRSPKARYEWSIA